MCSICFMKCAGAGEDSGAGAGGGAGARAGVCAGICTGSGVGTGADYLTPWLVSVNLEEPLPNPVAPCTRHVAAVIVLQDPGAVAFTLAVLPSNVGVEVVVQHLQERSSKLCFSCNDMQKRQVPRKPSCKKNLFHIDNV